MAYQGKIIKNKVTGQQIEFKRSSADTNGQLLEMETTYLGNSIEPVPHYHPFQEEEFTVLKGQVKVRMHGKVIVLKVDEKLFIPPKQVHSMWNDTDQMTVLNWKVSPALDTEYFLENAFGLANDGRTSSKGVPNLWQTSLLVPRFQNVFRITKPPFWVQKLVFFIMRPIARLIGYRSSYNHYLD